MLTYTVVMSVLLTLRDTYSKEITPENFSSTSHFIPTPTLFPSPCMLIKANKPSSRTVF